MASNSLQNSHWNQTTSELPPSGTCVTVRELLVAAPGLLKSSSSPTRPSKAPGLIKTDGPDSGYASQASSTTVSPFKTPEESNHGQHDNNDGISITNQIGPAKSRLWSRARTTVRAYKTAKIPEATWKRFRDLQELFEQPLHTFLTKKIENPGKYAIRLFMTRDSGDKDTVCIFVLCEASTQQRMRSYFRQQAVREQYQSSNTDPEFPNFGIVVSDRPPQWIAATASETVWLDLGNRDDRGPVVKYQISENLPCRYSTLGGVVKVTYADTNFLYGATVRHVFDHELKKAGTSGPSFTTWDDERTEEFDFGTDSDSDDSPSDAESLRLEGISYQDLESIADDGIKPCMHVPGLEGRSYVAIVPRSDLSSSSFNMDWALVNITDISEAATIVAKTFEISSSPSTGTFTNASPYHSQQSETYRPVTLNAAFTGRASGELSLLSSFIMMDTNGRLVKTHTLRLNDGSALQKGDCGTWVVDVRSRIVYGHVVACDAFGDAYVVPIQDTLESIRTTLQVDSVTIYSTDAQSFESSNIRNTGISLVHEEIPAYETTDILFPEHGVEHIEFEEGYIADLGNDPQKRLDTDDPSMMRSYSRTGPQSKYWHGHENPRELEFSFSTPHERHFRPKHSLPDSGYASWENSTLSSAQTTPRSLGGVGEFVVPPDMRQFHSQREIENRNTLRNRYHNSKEWLGSLLAWLR